MAGVLREVRVKAVERSMGEKKVGAQEEGKKEKRQRGSNKE